jgi:16S rRNA (uracil1498-N3)-methyltransferase
LNLFYTPAPITDHLLLEGEEAHHCARVLRLREGDTLCVTDGRGTLAECELTTVWVKSCEARVVKTTSGYGKRDFCLHLAVAPTKNLSRFEWFLEKATEIGIDEITPLLCEHSERVTVKTDRLQKILVSAMKQSLKAYLPLLNEPVKFADFIRQPRAGGRFIAYCSGDDRKHLKEAYTRGKDAVVIIGPEGDFSEKEVEMALVAGYVPVSLGKSRLRTETAALAACHMINLMNE